MEKINLKNHKSDEINLIVPGQGVFIFYGNNSEKVSFSLFNKDKTDGFNIEIVMGQVRVNRIGILDPLIDDKNINGITDLKNAYYWFSIDTMNHRFYAGIGEARLETKIYEYNFKFSKEGDELRKKMKKFLESITTIHNHKNSNIIPIKLLRDPITLSIPLLVRNTNDLSMSDIASGKYLPKSNLSLSSQKLYDCISGNKFILDDMDFPEFSKAIEHSIINPDGWCYKKLRDKSTEFNKDNPNLDETYLRITLGENNGESPGIPYVMEIWPIGHYSPIHNHAGAEAIIRVLHGTINVSLYPFLCGDKDKNERFSNVNFVKDDITWISTTLNQTHKLLNLDHSTNTCITIQCYMYDNTDINHYDYFDYIDNDGIIQQYEPDSDMDFVDFKNLMKEEWNNNKSTSCCFPKC